MVLYYRRKVILAILEKIGGSTTAKCMQKYLFIFTRNQQSGERIYDFLPYKYGCFSFVANNDIQALAHQGFLTIDDVAGNDKRYTLTHDMKMYNQLDLFDQQTVFNVVNEFGGMSQNELIAYTYRRWPNTAINSRVKNELLTPEELAKVEKFKTQWQSNEPALMTLGYEGLSIEKYIGKLISLGVKVLCDVRKNAYSMKYGFKKETLKLACEAVGIKYVHIPQLGIESDKRQSLKTQADYDALFDEFERTTLVDNRDYLVQLKSIVDDEVRVCLLCFERDPRQCHRTRVANAVMTLPDVNFKYIPITL